MDCQLEEGQRTVEATVGDVAEGTPGRWHPRGRRSAPAPDDSVLPAKLIALIQQRFAFLNGMFNALGEKKRAADNCLYDTATVLWMVILGFLCRKGTRNAMDVDRNTGAFPMHLMALSGQRRWPKGRPLTAPCTETATRLLDILAPGQLEQVLVNVADTLLRAKVFDSARLNNWVLILIDGTKQENVRRWFEPWKRKYRYVLHAKILGPDGIAFTVMAESCDHYDTETGKLDCERNAFHRLTVRLKKAFPRLPICLVGDALFACDACFEVCQRYEWKFIFTLKEGSQPTAFDEVLQLLPIVPGNHDRLICLNVVRDARWVDQVMFGNRRLSVVLQGEYVSKKEPYFCAWVTNILIANPERARGIAAAGRSRSRIEESYNVQKNGGFGLEHAFRETDRGAANYHLLMQFAHNFWQLLNKGCLQRLFAQCRKLTDECLAKLLTTALHARPPPREPLPAFQLRFADG